MKIFFAALGGTLIFLFLIILGFKPTQWEYWVLGLIIILLQELTVIESKQR